MAQNSKIEWTDHTFNPWIGCTKVSPGCAHCYAEQLMATRYGRVEWGAGKPRVRTSAKNWSLPIFWERLAARDAHELATTGKVTDESGAEIAWHRPRVFCASLADWLDHEVKTQWRVDLLALIEATPHLDWLLLTKRPESWSARMHEAMGAGSKLAHAWLNGNAPANVWIGTTVEDQPRADERIPELLKIPAPVRFLSCEPLLGPLNLEAAVWQNWRVTENMVRPFQRWEGGRIVSSSTLPGINWVICGGESGPGARPFAVEWADDLRRQCEAAGGAFFMKQLGAHVRTSNANAHEWPEHVTMNEVEDDPGFAAARVGLNDRKGGDMAEFPEELRVREFPKT